MSFEIRDLKSERDAALDQVGVLRETLRVGIATLPFIDGNKSSVDGLLARFDKALSNTSATAQQRVEAIRREAVEAAWKRVEKMPPCEDWDEAWDAIRAAILGEKEGA